MSVDVSAQEVKKLREATGAGMMDCKKALIECGGDFSKATLWLREKGLAKAAKRLGREANEGIIEAYVHLGGRIGVLVEVNSETDFVARNEMFREFAHDIALQIAAMKPTWIEPEDVPEEVLETERGIIRKQAEAEGKPPGVVERIVTGRLEKFYEERCLVSQPSIKDNERRVGEILDDLRARIGENLVIRRFIRFELGGDTVLAERKPAGGQE
ncbi:MAG: translation elongation factor Ts [Bacillota bacterium]|nr:MAG: translation elongation factor Ts [Bacillota bacterium]